MKTMSFFNIDPFMIILTMGALNFIGFLAVMYAIMVGDRFFVERFNDCIPKTSSRIGWKSLHVGRWSLASGLGLASLEYVLRVFLLTKYGKEFWMFTNAAIQVTQEGGHPALFLILHNSSNLCFIICGIAFSLHIVLNHRHKPEQKL